VTAIAESDAETLAKLREDNQRLRQQLEAKSQVAARALATYQQRVLQMEEHSAALLEANQEIKLVNERLRETLQHLAEKDRRITEDLHQARTFQQRILPELPRSAWCRFSVVYRPAELVGGDLYDVTEIAPGRFRLFIADAAGHGVQAALRTMILKSEYDRAKDDGTTPEKVLMAMNERIAVAYPGLELHCTAACLDLEQRAGGATLVRYATAAHPPLLHFTTDGQARHVYQPGPFLGVVRSIQVEAVEFEARAGESLFLYSDGVSEQWAPDGTEFGMERVEKLLARRGDIGASTAELFAHLDQFLHHGELADDATLLGVELT
jgi:phosphoserine phosphatase RsbU/P